MSGLVLAVASVMVLLSASRPPARCAGDDLLAIPGKWLPLRDENGRSPVPTGEFKQVSQRIERFDRLFRAAYPQPKGIQVEAYWSFRGSGKPYPYAFTSLYKAWYCNDNIDALMIYGMSGGNPRTVEAVTGRLTLEGRDKILTDGLVAYLRSEHAKAALALAPLDPMKEGGELGGRQRGEQALRVRAVDRVAVLVVAEARAEEEFVGGRGGDARHLHHRLVFGMVVGRFPGPALAERAGGTWRDDLSTEVP